MQRNAAEKPACELERMQGDIDDALLLEFLAERSDRAFAALARRALPRMLRFFRALGCRGNDAEDLAQNVLCILYRKAETIREPQSYWAWMYRVARNELLCHVRRSARQVPLVELDEAGAAGLAERSGAAEPRLGQSFADWMEWLEPGERQVMALRYVEDCGYEEIAQMLGIPVGTVKSRLFKAKSKLAKRLPGPRSATRRQGEER